jgi:hypothetical protein
MTKFVHNLGVYIDLYRHTTQKNIEVEKFKKQQPACHFCEPSAVENGARCSILRKNAVDAGVEIMIISIMIRVSIAGSR